MTHPSDTVEHAASGISNDCDQTVPTIDTDGVPDRCLSLTIQSDWGHFRRIDRTVTKQTYRLPPRTTIAGLLAGIVGVPRDEYYDVFTQSSSSIAITPVTVPRTITQARLDVGTNPDTTFTTVGGSGQHSITVSYPRSTDYSQIHTYEFLIDPTYRIDIAVENHQFYTALKRHLERGTSHYPPSMGLSECLAWIDYHGEHSVTPLDDDTVTVQSAIPGCLDNTIPKPGLTYALERVPGFMTADSDGRRPTGYVDFVFNASSTEGIPIRPQTVTPVTVDDRTVVFC